MTTNFDWLADLRPLFSAQESWLDGSYSKTTSAHLFCHTESNFSIACGAGLLTEHIRRFRFSPPVMQRLGRVTDAQGRSVFQESFLNHLQRMHLRAHVNAAPEGTLLLPDEPILSIQGPELQVQLLESAIRLLIWESTCWATKSAQEQWAKQQFSEEETPHSPAFAFDKTGWKLRAKYIGGSENFASESSELPYQWPGLSKMRHTEGQPLAQIRRLFKGEHPLGDVWLTPNQDDEASVSHTHIRFADEKSSKPVEIQMSRFQNLLHPVLVKGHSALSSPSLDYLRQRTWKQLEAFHEVNLDAYPRGWYVGQ